MRTNGYGMNRKVVFSACVVLLDFYKKKNSRQKGKAPPLQPQNYFGNCCGKWKCLTIRIFAWGACKDGLPSFSNLQKKINLKGKCIFCDKEVEVSAHALFFCPRVYKWWTKYMPYFHGVSTNMSIMEIVALVRSEGTAEAFSKFFLMA